MSPFGRQAAITPPTINALAASPMRWRRVIVTTSGSRRLDAPDQLVELGRGVANIVRELANDFQRLLGLPDFQQFADEILVVLQRMQERCELRARVLELLGRTLGLALELAPLVDQVLPLLGLEAVVLRQRFQLDMNVV